MGSSATAQSGSRLLFATNHFITTTSLIGSCEQHRPSMNAMDGLSFQSCLTTGHLKDVIGAIANARRLCAGGSGTAAGHARQALAVPDLIGM
eukprot:2628057-Pyramimonas_sp.AAC.1